MAKTKKTTKKAKEKEEAATAATPPAQEPTQTDEQVQAAIAQEAAKADEKAKEEAATKAPKRGKAADTVMVLVGPNSVAGRVVLDRVAYDSKTPRPMAKADYERLRAQYDLREAKDS